MFSNYVKDKREYMIKRFSKVCFMYTHLPGNYGNCGKNVGKYWSTQADIYANESDVS